MAWSYSGNNGPDTWHKNYSAAGGSCQSPIDIRTTNLVTATSNSNRKLTLPYCPNELNMLHNTGHSWQATSDFCVSAISGGPLVGDYELVQMHGHWGDNGENGSEHTVDGKRFAAELHLVHWNKSNYKSIEEAMQHPDGLCVLAVFLELGDAHPEMQKIVDKIPDILHQTDKCKLDPPINLKKLLPQNLAYWSYTGSLTTPPCLECVVWILFKTPVKISQKQLEIFRTLRCHPSESCETNSCCDDKVKTNYRPILFPLGDRVIIRSD